MLAAGHSVLEENRRNKDDITWLRGLTAQQEGKNFQENRHATWAPTAANCAPRYGGGGSSWQVNSKSVVKLLLTSFCLSSMQVCTTGLLISYAQLDGWRGSIAELHSGVDDWRTSVPASDRKLLAVFHASLKHTPEGSWIERVKTQTLNCFPWSLCRHLGMPNERKRGAQRQFMLEYLLSTSKKNNIRQPRWGCCQSRATAISNRFLSSQTGELLRWSNGARIYDRGRRLRLRAHAAQDQHHSSTKSFSEHS